jgi:hypothetical protein
MRVLALNAEIQRRGLPAAGAAQADVHGTLAGARLLWAGPGWCATIDLLIECRVLWIFREVASVSGNSNDMRIPEEFWSRLAAKVAIAE